MFTVIPRHYHAPKWQAAVPASSAFRFKDGTIVSSLFELKQALMTLPEEVVIYHIDPNRHDIANWVRAVVKDFNLADELSKQYHRWGLIVTLERMLMRELNLPDYVAKRWLGPATDPFIFSSGESVRTLAELKTLVQSLSDAVIGQHLTSNPNDLSLWVKECVGDYELAEMLGSAANRLHLTHLLEDHLAMLTDAAA